MIYNVMIDNVMIYTEMVDTVMIINVIISVIINVMSVIMQLGSVQQAINCTTTAARNGHSAALCAGSAAWHGMSDAAQHARLDSRHTSKVKVGPNGV